VGKKKSVYPWAYFAQLEDLRDAINDNELGHGGKDFIGPCSPT
jgi:hypothetical protein